MKIFIESQKCTIYLIQWYINTRLKRFDIEIRYFYNDNGCFYS